MPLSRPNREAMAAIVGHSNVIENPKLFGPFTDDFTDHYKSKPLAVIRPKNTEELSEVVKYCYAHELPMIPQGGNTSLTAAASTSKEDCQLIISLTKMKRLLEVDPDSDTMTVESGMTLEEVQNHAREADRLFPLSFGSKGNATVGGCLACNAGGVNVLRFGSMRDLVLGIEAVLPDGRIWNGLRALRKDNTGYSLRDLFIGSEGTLGIITKAVLKLYPQPLYMQIAYCGVQSPKVALELLQKCREEAGSNLTAFELISSKPIERVRKYLPDIKVPENLTKTPWVTLIEISSRLVSTAPSLFAVLEEAFLKGWILDCVVAKSTKEEQEFWHIRESIPLADRTAGGSIHSDISLPIAAIPEFIEVTTKRLQERFPWLGDSVYGHLGDGNLHFNMVCPEHPDLPYENEEEIRDILYSEVNNFKGSISAEHGIGQLKREHNYRFKDSIEIEMMEKIKDAFDPKWLLNPDKLLRRPSILSEDH
ncbi:MAG: FAD-binding oxidoreductase [Burkholderiales bacterium]|nr:FAD-binding oxidoreductase [Burkholderiales bacterium]